VIGQSFSEIFFGNSVVLGLPCPTASAGTLDTLMTAVEQDPATEIIVDLAAMLVTARGVSHELFLPAAAREAFLDGSWDATGSLLERFEEVEAVATRLPYVTGAW
jgi:3-isopropylmalate/(R)-2-methylmalate dehydratase small subunit